MSATGMGGGDASVASEQQSRIWTLSSTGAAGRATMADHEQWPSPGLGKVHAAQQVLEA